MIAGARQASSDARARGAYGSKFIPQAIKWLNDQRFQDYAAISFEDDPQALDWESIIKFYKKTGVWSKWAGSDPSSPACAAPRDLLEKYGIALPSSSAIEAPALRTMQ